MSRNAARGQGARDWSSLLPALTDAPPAETLARSEIPDRRDGAVYLMSDDLVLAVDVALATHRPLLLRGEPGSGKSSLAAYIARNLDWRYYEHVVTARDRPRDLLYTFDSVRKLADASVPRAGAKSLKDHRYIEPGVLWWAFDRESALRRGAPSDKSGPPAPIEPYPALNAARLSNGAVVLVDEIDKADPDLPNGLLVPLGSAEFRVAETGTLVTKSGLPALGQSRTAEAAGQSGTKILVVITTNEERDLPPAFVRRCVTHRLPAPGVDELVQIGRQHLLTEGISENDIDNVLLSGLARRVQTLRDEADKLGRRAPSTAEFLDALHACRELDVSVDDDDDSPDDDDDSPWDRLQRLVLDKHDDSMHAGASRDGV